MCRNLLIHTVLYQHSGVEVLNFVRAMESLKKDRILEFLPDTLEVVRAAYGLEKPGRMKEAIEMLEEWVKKQQHFRKKDFSREYLERLIITRKGSLERAKAELDKICTFRTLLPQFFGDFDPRADFQELKDRGLMVLLPKLTEDYNRVGILKILNERIDPIVLLQYFRISYMQREYLKTHDYAAGFVLVHDYLDVNLTEILMKINLTDLRNGMTIFLQGYGVRLKSMHILTKSKYVDVILKIAKQVVSAKIVSRINVHESREELSKFLSKDILPLEYGGTQKSVHALNEEWLDILSLDEIREYNREICKATTDESLRNRDVFNDQYMGMPGTFRTLSVD